MTTPASPDSSSTADTTVVEADRRLLMEANSGGMLKRLGAHTRLSGPGWLQSAITLGGGTLAGCLFLGVIGGYEMMWLQPLMMFLGIVMLSAIGYVTLSTGKRPFAAIRDELNPVLAWGWLGATVMANLVWAMPQFALGTAAVQQNLLPGVLDGNNGRIIITIVLAVASLAVVLSSVSGGRGAKIFEWVLKIMVAGIVISFFGVVAALALSPEGLPWGKILAGFIPNPSLLFEPAATYRDLIPLTSQPEFWHDRILTLQRDLMVTGAATAVGINMTFLLPYSMLKRGWDRHFRGQAVFDLGTGLFIPFVLVTSCVVIAATSRFHGTYDRGLVGEAPATAATTKLMGSYHEGLDARIRYDAGPAGATLSSEELTAKREALPIADKRLAAMLVQRDAGVLADALAQLTGQSTAQLVFGLGVFGMAISTIIVLMLINGYALCEAFDRPGSKRLTIIGVTLPALTGALGFLFLWGSKNTTVWLAVPTSVFGMALLPIAAITFLFLMNSPRLLGEHMPRGGKRWGVNILLIAAVGAATVGASWAIWSKVGWGGVIAVGVFLGMALVAHVMRGARPKL